MHTSVVTNWLPDYIFGKRILTPVYNTALKISKLFVILLILGTSYSTFSQDTDIINLEISLNKFSDQYKQTSTALDNNNIPIDSLNGVIQKLLVVQDSLRNKKTTLTDVLKVVKVKLDSLGPPPSNDQPREARAVRTSREKLNKQIDKLTDMQTSVDQLNTNINALVERIGDVRQSYFRSKLSDKYKQISIELDNNKISLDSLNSHLQELLVVQDSLRNDKSELTKFLNTAKDKLASLGPGPAEGQPSEAIEIATTRNTLNKQISKFTGQIKSDDLLNTNLNNLMSKIRALRQANFRSFLSARSVSPFSSSLWSEAKTEFTSARTKLTDHFTNWLNKITSISERKIHFPILLVTIAIALFLFLLPRFALWKRLDNSFKKGLSSSEFDQQIGIVFSPLSHFLITLLGVGVLYLGLHETGLITDENQNLARRICFGTSILVFIWYFGLKLFSEGPSIALKGAYFGPHNIRRFRLLFFAIIVVFVLDRIASSVFEFDNGGLKLTMAQSVISSSLFAVLLFLLLNKKLFKHKNKTPINDQESDVLIKNPGKWEILRYVTLMLAILILIAVSMAYLRFASFLFHRIVLLVLFLIFFWSIKVIAYWALSQLPTSKQDEGLDASTSDKTISFWLWVAINLNMTVFGIPALFLVLGFDWLDIEQGFIFIFSDLQIGAVSISIKNILTGIFVFFLISVGTRWFTGNADKRMIKYTRVDPGLRNSMLTLINYLGVIIGFLVGFSIVGIEFSKLMLVAGGLSVGIGFGLQNIINDFFSGLIMLFERPIKIGDWVSLSAGQGYVKRISVRSTVIETFDRSTIIIPNSEFVSSPLTNWFFNSRNGRIIIPVGVSYDSDPEVVKEILLQCAAKHPAVAKKPNPFVRFMEFGDSSLDFNLFAFLRDYNNSADIKSELHFAIFKSLKEAGISIPFPQRDVHIFQDENTKVAKPKVVEPKTVVPKDGKGKNPSSK